MKPSHPIFWIAGWGGVIAGVLVAALGLLSADELMNAFGVYGLLVAGCGLFLVAGLKVREMVARRRTITDRLSASKQVLTQR